MAGSSEKTKQKPEKPKKKKVRRKWNSNERTILLSYTLGYTKSFKQWNCICECMCREYVLENYLTLPRPNTTVNEYQ